MTQTAILQMISMAAAAVTLSFLLTSAMRRIAPVFRLLDCPDGGRKSHRRPTPLMGGVAVFGTFLLCMLSVRWWGLLDEFALGRLGNWSSMLLVSGGLFCLLGLWDDKVAMRARDKFLGQILASLPLAIWGGSIASVHFLGWQIALGAWSIPFTVFWLVACANIINLTDGLDGLAGTIGLIVSVALVALSLMLGKVGIALMGLILAGSLVGFLLHNWPPAKIFLGDSGSLTIGFLVGALSIQASMKTTASFMLAIPIVLISVPIFDTCMAIVRRKLTGQGIGQADRKHLHHCLQDRGLTNAQALWAISGLCTAMAFAAVTASWLRSDWIALSLCSTMLGFLIIARVFGYREAQLFFQHVQAAATLLVDSSGALRTRMLLARINADAPEQQLQFWDLLRRRVKKMGGLRLEFRCQEQASQRELSRLEWQQKDVVQPIPGASTWQFSYSVPRGDGTVASLTAEGTGAGNARWQRLDDLFRAFDVFCTRWPLQAGSHVTSTNALGQFARQPQPAAAQRVPVAVPVVSAEVPVEERDSQSRAA